MTTFLHDVVTPDPSGVVRVCAWCVARPRLLQLHRDYRCTDGMCPACRLRMAQQGRRVVGLVLGVLLLGVGLQAQAVDCVRVSSQTTTTMPGCVERLIVTAAPIARPSALAPALALVVGSSLDLASTLRALQRVPGSREGNPVLAHGGTAGLIVTKIALTGAIVWSVNRLTHHDHPTAAKVIGYVGGIVLSGVALQNLQVGR